MRSNDDERTATNSLEHAAAGRQSAALLTPNGAALHRNFRQATMDLKRDIVRVVYYLERITSRRIHSTLGFRTIEQYASTTAGFSPAQTRRFLELGRKLRDYPEVARALGRGNLSFASALLICTKTRPEQQWKMIDAARTMTTRELRSHLRGETTTKEDRSPMRPEVENDSQVPISDDRTAPTPLTPLNGAEFGEAIVAHRSPATESETPVDPVSVIPESPDKPREEPTPEAIQDQPIHVTLRFTADQYQRWCALADHHRKKRSFSNAEAEGGVLRCGDRGLNRQAAERRAAEAP